MPPKKSNPAIVKKASPTKTAPTAKKAPAGKKVAAPTTTTGKDGTSAQAPAATLPEEMTGFTIPLKQIAATLIHDKEGEIKKSGRWPLVVDESGRTGTFLKYQHTNFVDTSAPAEMQPESVRKALLGSIRYGKVIVFDMGENEGMFDNLTKIFNEIQPGLMDQVLNKSVLEEENYLKLARPQDGEEYTIYKFSPDFIAAFRAVFLTMKSPVPAELKRLLLPVMIE